MFTRYASAISTGTIMTLALIYIMQTLITIQPGVITEPRPRATLDWIRLPQPVDPVRTIDHKPRKEELMNTLVPPATRLDFSSEHTIGVPLPTQTVLTGPQVTTLGYSDGPLVTMINVQPAYPIRAVRQGLEGHVIVEFDVDGNGRPQNIRVVEASHQVFVKAAVKAAERIKFRARVVDGNPVMTSNVRKLFRFEMEND